MLMHQSFSQDMAAFKIAGLQKALEESIPGVDLEQANKKYHELTEKYRDLLEKGNNLVLKAEMLTGLEVRKVLLIFMYSKTCVKKKLPGCIAQSVTCLTTDASLTANPGIASSIPARSHTFVEIDREIISTFILLPSAESFKKGCCQLQAKVCARSTG